MTIYWPVDEWSGDSPAVTKQAPTRAILIAQHWVYAVTIGGVVALFKLCTLIQENMKLVGNS
jgi:hypothetical protein